MRWGAGSGASMRVLSSYSTLQPYLANIFDGIANFNSHGG